MKWVAWVFGGIGICTNAMIYQQKNRAKLLLLKLISDAIWGVHYLFLGAYSGLAITVIAIFRELVFMHRPTKKWAQCFVWPIFFALLAIGSSVLTWKGPISVLPALASAVSVFGFWIGNPRLSRILTFPISSAMFTYDACIDPISVPGIINEAGAITSAVVGIIRHDLARKKRDLRSGTGRKSRGSFMKRAALLCLFGAMLIWGVTPIVVKSALDTYAPGLIIFARAALAALVLGVLSVGKLRKGISRRFLLFSIATGLIVAAGYLTQTIGTAFTTPAKSAFLENIYCLIVPLLTWALTKKRPTALNFFCMLLCIGGVLLIGLDSFDGTFNRGDLLSIAAGLFFGVNLVLTGLYLRERDGLVYTFLQMATIAVVGLVWTVSSGVKVLEMTAVGVWRLLFLGVVSTAVAWAMRNHAQRILPPIAVSTVLPFSAVVSTVISVLAGRDRITLPLLAGAILLLAAILTDVICTERKRRKEEREEHD